MKQFYLIHFVALTLSLNAQTTVNYPQQTANYNAFFTDSGGHFDQGTSEFGMWANGGGAKQSAAWRNFTIDGTTTGTSSTMAVGDSFTITVSATQASFGQIGLALLSSPTATSTWNDRINNYAVQVNLNGNGGANDPWEVVSSGGTVNASSIGSSSTYSDFTFQFTLNSATTMAVSINNETETFNVTLNNQNITGYSVYFADDYNGTINANIYWKPSTEYTYATSLNVENQELKQNVSIFPNPANNYIKINTPLKVLNIYDIQGKLVKKFTGSFMENKEFNISNLKPNIYILETINNSGNRQITKLVKK